MIYTRPIYESAIAEEKKDEYDPMQATASAETQYISHQNDKQIVRDEWCRNNHQMNRQKGIEETPRKSPLLFLSCALGITSCYLWYGTVQETLFKLNSNRSDESITLFLLATGTFSSFLLAWFWTSAGQKILVKNADGHNAKTEGTLNHILLLLTAITYLSAMAASNESLHYVSYPTCVLAKSSKLIPTMVVGWLVDKIRGLSSHGGNKSHSIMEWIGAALITMGILSFQYTQLQKQQSSHHHGGKEAKGDSPYGLALLGLSLFMDGLLGACQSALKRKSAVDSPKSYRPPTAMETMLYINLYATLVLLPASYYAGQFQNGIKMFCQTNEANNIPALLFKLTLSASLGQVFIFLTIHHFSPLICTTITTTRKFFTILLSVYKFGHVLNAWQWGSVGLVFGGLYLEIVAKMVGESSSASSSQEVKKKEE